MLCVTVEIGPGGFEPGRRVVGSLRVPKVSASASISSCEIDLAEAANHLTGMPAPGRRLPRREARPPSFGMAACRTRCGGGPGA